MSRRIDDGSGGPLPATRQRFAPGRRPRDRTRLSGGSKQTTNRGVSFVPSVLQEEA
jgi:hypothetical protein